MKLCKFKLSAKERAQAKAVAKQEAEEKALKEKFWKLMKDKIDHKQMVEFLYPHVYRDQQLMQTAEKLGVKSYFEDYHKQFIVNKVEKEYTDMMRREKRNNAIKTGVMTAVLAGALTGAVSLKQCSQNTLNVNEQPAIVLTHDFAR